MKRHFWLMRRSHLTRLMAALSSLGLFAYPAQALPFHKTGTSYETYLNSLNWNAGKDYRFFRLYNCSYRTSNENIYDNQKMLENEREVQALRKQQERIIDKKWHANQAIMSAHALRDDDEAYRMELLVKQLGRRSNALEERIEQLKREKPVKQVLTYEHFSCSGYVRVSDPRGYRICEMKASYNGKSRETSFKANGCVWK